MSNGDLAEDEIDEHGDIVDFNLTIVVEVGVDAERELILVEHRVLTRSFSPAGVNVKVVVVGNEIAHNILSPGDSQLRLDYPLAIRELNRVVVNPFGNFRV